MKTAIRTAAILAAAGLGMVPAQAAQIAPNDSHLATTLQYPGAPKRIYEEPRAPYALNYADEAARNLGVKDGHMDVFSTHPAPSSALLPSLSGGLGGDGAMVKLQWRPGQ